MPELNGTVRVLDEDPDLGARVPDAEAHAAGDAAVAAALRLERGPWTEMPRRVDPGALGFLVLDGMLSCTVRVAGRANVELVGRGDVLRPWVVSDGTLPQEIRWNVMLPAQLAWLDRDFAIRTARWPEITAALVDRLVVRARHLLFQRAASAIPRVDERLLLVLWDLADRWGRVRVDGVHLPLPLSHSLLASIVGAQRPSVTTALGRLRREELVHQVPGGWLLIGAPPTELAASPAEPARTA